MIIIILIIIIIIIIIIIMIIMKLLRLIHAIAGIENRLNTASNQPLTLEHKHNLWIRTQREQQPSYFLPALVPHMSKLLHAPVHSNTNSLYLRPILCPSNHECHYSCPNNNVKDPSDYILVSHHLELTTNNSALSCVSINSYSNTAIVRALIFFTTNTLNLLE